MLPTKTSLRPQLEEWAYVRKGAPRYWVWLALVLIGAYFAWFYWQPVFGEIRRLDLFLRLLLPTDLWYWTVGNGAENLQVGVTDRLLPLSLTAIWILAAWWIGRPSLYLISCRLSWLEYTAIRCLFGLSLLSTSTLLLGLAGSLTRTTLVAGVVALCIASLALQRFLGFSANHFETQSIPSERLVQGQAAQWMWRLVPVGVCMLVAMYIANGWMPPFEFDVVEYHAQAPKEFYQQGKIDFVAHNVYANMPLGIEMHSLAAMVLVGGQDGWWLGGISGNCIISMFSLLSVGLASGFAARYFGRSVGWAAAATLLSAPGNILSSGCGLVDSALGAYVLATAICLQCYRESRLSLSKESQATPLPPSSLILACFFAGSAAACKYTGLVFACVPALFYLLLGGYSDLRRWSSVKPILVAALMCIASIAPWFIKNQIWTANPVYPLGSALFGAGNLSAEQSQQWSKAHQVPKSPNGSAYDWASLKSSLHTLAGKSEYLPAVLVPLVLVGVYVSGSNFSRHPVTLPLLLGGWILLVWWFATHRIDRFWFPSLPLFTIVAAAGMRWLIIRAQSAAVALCILISLAYAGVVGITGVFADSRWFISYDSLRQDTGSEESVGRVPKTIGWVNSNLPAESKVLAIGEARAYFFERSLLYATCFNTSPGESSLRQADAQEQSKWLKQNGVTHLFVQWVEIDRYRSPGNYGFSKWPQRADIELMIDKGVVRRVAGWPFDSQLTDLLEVKIDSVEPKVGEQ